MPGTGARRPGRGEADRGRCSSASRRPSLVRLAERTSRSRSSPGVPPADLQHALAEADQAAAAVHPQLVDVRQRDQGAAVDPDEAGLGPALLQRGQRDPDQVAAGRRCAAGRSRPAPRRSGPGSAGRTGSPRRARPRWSRRPAPAPGSAAGGRASTTRRTASASRCGRTGFMHVVGGAQVEGVERVRVVGGDEDDLRAVANRASTRARSRPSRPGIRMSQNTTSTARRPAPAAPRPRSRRCGRRPIRGSCRKQVGQLAQRGQLVVDDQRPQRSLRRQVGARAAGGRRPRRRRRCRGHARRVRRRTGPRRVIRASSSPPSSGRGGEPSAADQCGAPRGRTWAP